MPGTSGCLPVRTEQIRLLKGSQLKKHRHVTKWRQNHTKAHVVLNNSMRMKSAKSRCETLCMTDNNILSSVKNFKGGKKKRTGNLYMKIRDRLTNNNVPTLF